MTSVIADYILDGGLTKINTEATRILITSTPAGADDPMNYTQATSTYALGSNTFTAGFAFAAPTVSTSPAGEEVNSAAIAAGAVSVSGSATRWAVVDHTNSRLQAQGALSAPTSVTSSTTFQLASFKIKFPNQ